MMVFKVRNTRLCAQATSKTFLEIAPNDKYLFMNDASIFISE